MTKMSTLLEKRNKYNNKKCGHSGIKFDSEMERDFYTYLLQNNRKESIILQPKFELQEKFKTRKGVNIRSIDYFADFQIGNLVYDLKGFSTQIFLLKKKMFAFKYDYLELICITKAPKYSGKEWIELDELKKLRKGRKNV